MGSMINYNLVLWVGLTFYVLIIVVFITNEMDKRKKDREQWRLTQSYNKAKNDEQNRNDKRVKRNLKSVSL